jgi:hypothetical protein
VSLTDIQLAERQNNQAKAATLNAIRAERFETSGQSRSYAYTADGSKLLSAAASSAKMAKTV